MSSTLVRLSDEAELITKGTTPTTLGFAFADRGIPFIRAQNLIDGTVSVEADPLYISSETHAALKRSRIQPQDVLISIAGTIGRAAIVPEATSEMNCNQAVAIVRPSGRIDRRYLLHWLGSTEALRQISRSQVTGTISNLSLSQIGALEVPLPPMAEQKRIAAILDQADALRRLRRQALDRLNGLGQAIFREMFGDPGTNPMGWPTATVGSLCSRVTVGIVVKPASYYREEGIPAIRGTNIKDDGIDLSDLVRFSAEDNETKLKKTRVWESDLVIVRSGRPGLAAVVPKELDGANAIDVLIASPDKSKVAPTFLRDLLNSEGGKRLVLSESRGQVQQHFNVKSLSEAEIIVPSRDLQSVYETRLGALSQVRDAAARAKAETEAAFSSLQSRAFRSEL